MSPDPIEAPVQLSLTRARIATQATARHRQGSTRRLTRLIWRPGVLAGLSILLFWTVMAIAWPILAPDSPTRFDLIAKFSPPSSTHWLGTDDFGRDVLSRVLAGSRSVLLIASSATMLGVLLGTFIGLITGYYRGWGGEILMRAMDVLMAFPMVVIALLVIAVLGASKLNVVLVVAMVFAPYNARVVRSATLAQRDKEFVEAARLRGEDGIYIMLIEILPNIAGVIVVEITVRLALAIFTVATLSFLGLGIQPPTPDWGLMIAEGRQFYRIAPWIVLFPSVAIASLVVGVNLVAERLNR